MQPFITPAKARFFTPDLQSASVSPINSARKHTRKQTCKQTANSRTMPDERNKVAGIYSKAEGSNVWIYARIIRSRRTLEDVSFQLNDFRFPTVLFSFLSCVVKHTFSRVRGKSRDSIARDKKSFNYTGNQRQLFEGTRLIYATLSPFVARFSER